jgi:hypothetical protein
MARKDGKFVTRRQRRYFQNHARSIVLLGDPLPQGGTANAPNTGIPETLLEASDGMIYVTTRGFFEEGQGQQRLPAASGQRKFDHGLRIRQRPERGG